MTVLMDLGVEHDYTGKRFRLHPFTIRSETDVAVYELIGETKHGAAKGPKRSTHITYDELVEMLALTVFTRYRLRLRARPEANHYPTSPPGKRGSEFAITPGSPTDRRISAFDATGPISPGLQSKLKKYGVAE